jgi:hypothetical protein
MRGVWAEPKQVLLIDPLTLSDAVMNKVPAGAKNPEAFPYWHTRVIPLMGDPLEEHILTSVRVCCWRELCTLLPSLSACLIG